MLFDKLQYMSLLKGTPEKLDPKEATKLRILDYAAGVWSSLGLEPRKLEDTDMDVVYAFGENTLFHVKAFPSHVPNTFVIVIADREAKDIMGHILIDLEAEYNPPFLECPFANFEKMIETPDEIGKNIPTVNADDESPFAALLTGDGTYIQALNTGDGWKLEYQMVNDSNRYEATGLIDVDQVISAFESYGFGKHEWLQKHHWKKVIRIAED